MSGGGKGGKSTTEVKIPDWLESAARSNIGRAENVAALGPMPYYGPDVAAMTPMQTAAGQGINTAAGAFGLGTTDLSMGMPAPQTFAGGVQGYSSGGLYDQSLAELQRRAPGQYNAITGMFINPQTGAAPLSFGSSVPAMPPMAAAPVTYPQPAPVVDRGGSDRAPLAFGGGAGRGTTSMATPASYMPGGINTNNPNSVANRVAAALSGPQRAPTQADRPVARPAGISPAKGTSKGDNKSGSKGGASSSGGNKGGGSRGGSSGRR